MARSLRRAAFPTCPTASSAKQLKRDIEECIALGRDWKPESTSSEPDLEKVMEAYIDAQLHQIRETTRRRYGENLDLFKRFLRRQQPKGTLFVSLLSKPTLTSFYAWLHEAENGLHQQKRESETVRKIVEVAQLCWKWAYESENWPPGEIPPPKRIKMKRSEPAAVEAPTWAEMDAAVLACGGWQRKLATFLRYTGLRPGETMLLLWSDVDMKAGTLTVRKEIQKVGPTRTIPLCAHLLDELSMWGTREGYVIPSARKKGGNRERQARPRDMDRAWERAGVRTVAWEGQPYKAFRKGIKSELLKNPLVRAEAIDFLQGHTLGNGSSRHRYITAEALNLSDAVKHVPKIGISHGNVIELPRRIPA